MALRRKFPAASIVIVCWNSADHLPLCLQALRLQTYKDFEVILIDNASPRGEVSRISRRFSGLNIRLKSLPANTGFAAASNRGARLAKGAWLAMLNPDAYPDPRWLKELIAAARTLPNAFFASRQLQAARPYLLDGEGDVYYTSGLALRANYNRRWFGANQPRPVFSACAAAALYPRETFIAAGGFDEDYFAYHEDVDLGFRLRLRGFQCYLVQAAVVRHVGAGSTHPRSNFAIYHGHRNLVWTFAKNMPAPWVWLYTPLHIAINVVSIVYFMLTGHGVSIVRAKFDALRGLARALSKRQAVQASRAVPAAEVIRYMNSNPFGPLQGWISRQWPILDS